MRKTILKTLIIAVCTLLIAISSFAISLSVSNPITKYKDEIANDFKESQLEQREITGVKLLSSDNSGIIMESQVNRDDLSIEKVEVHNKTYHTVAFPDCDFTNKVGKPQIPINFGMIGIPESVNIGVEILSSKYTILPGCNIVPVPKLVERETPDGYIYFVERFSIDKDFYSTDGFYPDKLVEIESISYIRDQRVARISFYPLQYNPVTQELLVYSSIIAKVCYSHDAEVEITPIGPFDSICSDIVLNYDSSKTSAVNQHKNQDIEQGNVSYPSNLSDTNNKADYLIITSDEFYYPAKEDHDNGSSYDNRLNEFAHWRTQYNNFCVAVVTVNDSFIGGNTDANIKEFVEYVYENWSAPHMNDDHVGYILLVGDTPHIAKHKYTTPWNRVGASDRWLACIVGDDWLPDIMIGRWSIDNATELEIIADKTIHYEQNPASGDWHQKVLLCQGNYPWNFPNYDFTKKVLLECGGYKVSEVLYEEGGTGNDIRDNINDGRVIVNYCGRGSICQWKELFGSWNVNQLTNEYKLPIIFSLACQTGTFQGEEEYDCLGEIFLNTANKGGVAFFGASTITHADSFAFATYAFKAIFEKFEYTVGKIINYAIIQMYGNYNGFPEYNLLGDPALDISLSTEHLDKPDLAISHLNITISPEIPTTADDEVTINTTILNIGGDTVEDVAVHFIVVDQDGSQHIIGEQTVSEIPPGSYSELIQLWNISEEIGEKSLIVQIDPLGSIDEAFEVTFSPP